MEESKVTTPSGSMRPDANPNPDQNPDTPPKQPYEPPQLTEYGSVSTLTQGSLSRRGDFGPVGGFRARRNTPGNP